MARSRLLDSQIPLIAAPMAGGPTTIPLVNAVIDAGAFPFLAAGYKSVDAVASEVRQVRAKSVDFGVNLFVPAPSSLVRADYEAYVELLRPEATALGVAIPDEPHWDDDSWQAKIDLLVTDPVPLVSFTFGLPPSDDAARLRRAGTRLLATVTTPAEARAAQEAGMDGVIVQGPTAGGHSATFDPKRAIEPITTHDLLRSIRSQCSLPLIATGGVDGPRAVKELLTEGAESVAVGTLLLRTDEAGTTAAHRAALCDPAFDQTVLTHAFTGRTARGLRNAFTDRYTAVAPFGYPELHHLTRPIRQAASSGGDPNRLHLWAGTGYRSARAGSARDVIAWLSDSV